MLEVGEHESFVAGSVAPEPEAMPSVRHHARALRRWATAIEPALRGEAVEGVGMTDPKTFHDALARNARKVAPELVDVCLRRFPEARSVLDLGGLHGEYSLSSPAGG